MSKVIFDISMSLDGYITADRQTADEPMGPGGDVLHTWAFDGDDVDRDVFESGLAGNGAIICGMRTYTTSVPWWNANGPSGDARIPVFVVCHHAPADQLDAGVYTFVTTGIDDALQQARTAAAGSNVIVMGGADIGRQFLAAGLLDELSIHLAPVLFGGGTSMFDGLDHQHRQLTVLSSRQTPNATHLRLGTRD